MKKDVDKNIRMSIIKKHDSDKKVFLCNLIDKKTEKTVDNKAVAMIQ